VRAGILINVAFDLFVQGNRVLLVDNDPQFNATTFLMSPQTYLSNVINARDAKTIVDIYERPPRAGKASRSEVRADDVIYGQYEYTDRPIKLDLIPSRLELYETLDNASQKDLKLNKFLKKVQSAYDYILIDCPPTPSVLTRAAFAASRHVVIPVTPDHFATLGLPQFLATLRNFKEELTDEHNVEVRGVVLTRVPNAESAPVSQAIADVRHATSEYNLPLLKSSLPEMAIFKRAIWKSQPVHELRGRGTSTRGDASRAIRKIANEICVGLGKN